MEERCRSLDPHPSCQTPPHLSTGGATRDVLLPYARYVGDSLDYALNALIDATFAKIVTS
jgi:hypothetical protein